MTSSLFPAEFAITLVKSGQGWWGDRLMRELAAYPSYAVLGTEGECLPYESNRVTLSDEFDELGVPRPLVHFDYFDNEKAMRREMHSLATQILESAGAEEVHISEGNDHLMGGCRMGRSRADSVVDARCRTWDHPNLFICDASLFPKAPPRSPFMPIVQMAERLSAVWRADGG